MSDAGSAESCFSTPWDAPLVPQFPITFRNVDVMTLIYRTLPSAISALLPPPLTVISDIVLIHVYNMNDVDNFGRYRECNLMVAARLNDHVMGAYSPYLFLDSDVGLAYGREVHGQPKKLAHPQIELRGDLLVGTVERNGIEIITGTMGYKQRNGNLETLRTQIDFITNLNYKVIPNVDGTPAIRQITSRRLSDVKVHECWTGPCTVELRQNVQAPVYKLPVVESLDGYYWRADFALVEGTVVYDYLREQS